MAHLGFNTDGSTTAYFRGSRTALSNMYWSGPDIQAHGTSYSSTEVAYHSIKAQHHGEYDLVSNLDDIKNPWEASKLSKKVVPKELKSWQRGKRRVMRDLLNKKLRQVPAYQAALREADQFVEITGHPYWGRGTKHHPGANVLGKLHRVIKQQLPPVPPKVVIIGDSLLRDLPLPELLTRKPETHRTQTQSLYPSQPSSTSYMIKQECVDSFLPYHTEIHVNPGITTRGLRQRVHRHLQEWLTGAYCLVIMAGTNDLSAGYSPESTLKSICAIQNELQQYASVKHISCVSVLYRADGAHQQEITKLNEQLSQHFGTKFIHATRRLNLGQIHKHRPSSQKINPDLYRDDVHLKPAGLREVAFAMSKHLAYITKR